MIMNVVILDSVSWERSAPLYSFILQHIKLSDYIEGIILNEVILYRCFRHELSMSKVRMSCAAIKCSFN